MGQARVPTPETEAVSADAAAPQQQIDLTTRLEAERLGAVAFHSGKARDASHVFPDGLLHRHWLNGWDAASQGTPRHGAIGALMDGLKAFADGTPLEACPYLHGTPEHGDWLEGWERARMAHQGVDRRRLRH